MLLAAALLGLIACGRSSEALRPDAPSGGVGAAPDQTLSSLSKYRTWTLVNPVPVVMEPVVAARCAPVVIGGHSNPHRDKYVSVYVNDLGRQAMLAERFPEFPPGAMIVKEKLASPSGRAPELLTAMVKREEGYNPGSGDWEYLALDGTAASITQRGKLESCRSCHQAYADTDYVTRQYLPDVIRRGLK
jgi:hypothetical protein